MDHIEDAEHVVGNFFLYKTAWKDLIENCGEYSETSDDIQIERIGSYRREKYDNRIG